MNSTGLTRVKLSQLKSNPNNPRIIKDDKFRKLVRSITEFPEMLEARPIVCDPDGVVLGGNMRLKACREAGLKEVPAYVVTWEEAKQREFIIKDNVGYGEWDWDELANTWDPVQLEEWGLDVWQEPKEEEGLTDPDEVPQIPEEPKTQPGDLYLLGDHRLLCGDSTKAEDVEKLMNGEKADMVFTDPPYGVSFRGVKGDFYSGGKMSGADSAEQIKGDNLRGDGLTALFRDALALAVAYSKSSAALYIFFAINRSEETLPAVSDCGLTVRNWLIWDKGNVGFHAMGAQYKPNFEAFLYAVKGEPPEWKGNHTQQTIWRHNVERLGLHSTMKPVSLVLQAVMNHSAGSVLDLFLGSGTTLIAAEKTGRTCYGMELDPKYCDVIVKRWEDFTGKKAELVRA
jgi:DNA modification methylase